MQSREITLTAPRGHVTSTRHDLRAAGCTNITSRPVLPALSDQEQIDRIVDLARRGHIQIQPVRPSQQRPERHRLTTEQVAAWISTERLEQAVRRGGGVGVGRYRYFLRAEQAVTAILRRVGPAGEQALADEQRYFRTFDVEQYDSSKHSGRDWREPSLAVVAPDGSAAIICYAEVGSYLHKGYGNSDGGPPAGGLHHLRFAVYLVVRDATSGERHVMRIPPRFGRYTSATYHRYMDRGDRAGLIRAAVAWTFGLRPEEYHPQVEA